MLQGDVGVTGSANHVLTDLFAQSPHVPTTPITLSTTIVVPRRLTWSWSRT